MIKTALLAGAALLAATAANAATVSYSHTSANSTAPYTDSFTLPAFNAALGTLTGVSVSFSASGSASIDVVNGNTTARAFSNATAVVTATITGPASLSQQVSLSAGPVADTVAARPGGPGTFGTFSASGLTVTGSASANPANLAAYTNPPAAVNLNFSVDFSDGNYTGTAGSGVFFGGSANVGGITTITYTYDAAPPPPPPVPAPATLALFGLGLGLVGFARRRG